MSTTPNIGLFLPDYSLPNWNVPVNQNFVVIDGAIAALQAAGVGGPGGTAAGTWSKYTLTISGANFFVNSVSAGALSTSSATQQIALYTTPARAVFHAAFIKHSVAFAGTSLTSIVVSLGTAAAPDTLMTQAGDTFNALASVSNSAFYLAGGAKMLSAAATAVILQMTVVGGFPAALTTGTLEVDVLSSILP